MAMKRTTTDTQTAAPPVAAGTTAGTLASSGEEVWKALAGLGAPSEALTTIQRDYLTEAAALWNRSLHSAAKPLPVVSGQDAEVASVKMIIAGTQATTIYKDTRELAKVAVKMVQAVTTGGTPETNDTKTYDNGKKIVPSMLLVPVEVDKSNYQKILIDGGYYTADQLK